MGEAEWVTRVINVLDEDEDFTLCPDCGRWLEIECVVDGQQAIKVISTQAARALYPLVADKDAEIERLRERVVTVDIDGRAVRYDRVAEAEAALDAVEQDNARLREEVVALRATLADAPHADGCLADGWLRSQVRGTCTCWKGRRAAATDATGGAT